MTGPQDTSPEDAMTLDNMWKPVTELPPFPDDLREDAMTQTSANWEGVQGEHRTVGPHRAWCFACQEWCYADSAMRCEHCAGVDEAAAARLASTDAAQGGDHQHEWAVRLPDGSVHYDFESGCQTCSASLQSALNASEQKRREAEEELAVGRRSFVRVNRRLEAAEARIMTLESALREVQRQCDVAKPEAGVQSMRGVLASIRGVASRHLAALTDAGKPEKGGA